jgi:hypothetical protein
MSGSATRTTPVSDSGNNRVQRWQQPVPPEVTTQAASEISGKAATLNGTVNPGSLATTYWFEYGLTSSYGTSVPVPGQSAGAGVEAVSESRSLSGLQPEATYHYRIVASNSEGPTYGKDTTFVAQPITSFLASFGSLGTGNGQFNRPGRDGSRRQRQLLCR